MKIAELQITLDSKKCSTTVNQRVGCCHTHISRFNILDYIIFISCVGKLYLLGIHVEACLTVIVNIKVNLLTNLCIHIDIDILIEIKDCSFASSLRQSGVVYYIPPETGGYLYITFRGYFYSAGTENRLQRISFFLSLR